VSRHIRETSPTEVCVVFIATPGILVDIEPEMILNGLLLIPRATEIIAEASKASRPIVPRDFRRDGPGIANWVDVWTCSWERGLKFRSIWSMVGHAGGSNANITW
jgi:hypothetical protein